MKVELLQTIDRQIINYILIGTLAFISGGMFPLSKYEKLNNIAAICVLLFPVLIILNNLK
jgi:hypothetical protein